MSKYINSDPLAGWEAAVEDFAAVTGQVDTMPQDIIGAARFTAKRVADFLVSKGLTKVSKNDKREIFAANESFTAASFTDTVGAEAVNGLMEAVGIPMAYRASCAKRIGASILMHLSDSNPAGVWNNYGKAGSSDLQNKAIPLSSIYPATILSSMNGDVSLSEASEAFGIAMNETLPDMKLTLTVALMQYITSFTQLLWPIVPTTQPDVIIKREINSVVDLTDKKMTRKPVIELYRDPETVSSQLKRIHPLMANDAAGEFLLADDIIKFDKTVNLQEISLVAGQPGWDRYNHTDIIADKVSFETAILEITLPADGADPAVTEQFEVKIPKTIGRFVPVANGMSSDRTARVDSMILLKKDTPMISNGGSTTSTILASLAATDGINVNYVLSGHINLEFSNIDAQEQAELSGYQAVAGQAVSQAVVDLLAKIKSSVKFVGYTIDARYSEENLRKTTLRSTLDYSTMNYTLPTARALVIDWAYGDQAEANAAARLTQIEHIGTDIRNLDIFDEISNSVHDEIKMYADNPGLGVCKVGERFAAGSVVNPFVFQDVIDFSKVVSVRSADGSGDIKQFVRTKLNAVTSLMLNDSMFLTQLTNGAKPVFRCLTSEWVKGNALMCRQIHAHLDQTSGGAGDVAYVMDLDNGVKLEIVTTTFRKMDNMLYIMPYINGSDSVLNWGKQFDQGTMVGNYTSSHDGLHQRVFSTARHMLIPTNVMCVKLEIRGLEDATSLRG